MAEAAGLAVGVIGFGFQVCAGLTKYVHALRSREEESSSLKQQVGQLESVLQAINARYAEIHPDDISAFAGAIDRIAKCDDDLQAIQQLIAKLFGSPQGAVSGSTRTKVKGKAKELFYPLQKDEVVQIHNRLCNVIASLQLAFQDINL